MTNSILNEALRVQRSGLHDMASQKYASILQADANHYSALVNNAVSLRKQRKYAAAKVHYERALMLQPDEASAWSNYGNLLCDMLLFDEAKVAHQRAMGLAGELPENLYNASIVPFRNNYPDLAIKMLDRILAAHPDHHNANWNRALAYLQLGDYVKGFSGYEVRCDKPEMQSRVMSVPRWQGEDIKDKRVLLTHEQGFGDVIQFVRFVQLLKAKGAQVAVESKPELMRLIQCVAGVDEVVGMGAQGSGFDFYLPLLSLPHLLQIDMDSLNVVTNYIDVYRIKTPELGGRKGLRVGLVWGSKPGYIVDRSCCLIDFAPLLKQPNVNFYSFQKGPASADITALGLKGLVCDLSQRIHDFYDTASYMKQMDLIISIDSSPGHLAGALGVRTWILLLHASDWRWLLNRTDSPWYPSARLYRQHAHNDWTDAMRTLAADFSDWVSLQPAV